MVEDPVEDGELKNFGIIWTALKYFISPLICNKCTKEGNLFHLKYLIPQILYQFIVLSQLQPCMRELANVFSCLCFD